MLKADGDTEQVSASVKNEFYAYYTAVDDKGWLRYERDNAVKTLAKEEDLDASMLNHYLSEYDYLQKEQPEIIQEALKEKHLGLIKKRKALTRILDKLRSIIRTFSWE